MVLAVLVEERKRIEGHYERAKNGFAWQLTRKDVCYEWDLATDIVVRSEEP